MPLPVRLKILSDLDSPEIQDEVRYELEMRGTVCEYPKCITQAVAAYRNAHSVVFLCEAHEQLMKAADPKSKFFLDKSLSEAQYGRMLNKSYVHLNNASGFILEEMVETFMSETHTSAAKEAAYEAAQRRELRKAFQDSKVKVGAPDDALMTGRQRNDLRERMGKPRIGPTPQQQSVTPVHTADLMPAPNPSPVIPAPLPFPDQDFL